MITVIGNTSKNKLNYYVWKSAIEKGLIEYLPDSSYFNPYTSSQIVIISYITIAEISEDSLRTYLSSGGKLFLYLFDTFSTMPNWLQHKIIKYYTDGIIQEIFSFDFSDCKNHGFVFWPQICSRLECVKIDNRPGFYFAGRKKGRLPFIKDVAQCFNKQRYSSYLRIPDIIADEMHELKEIGSVFVFNTMIPYEDMLNEELSYNCIFDITQDCQQGFSWRFIEGILYHKKIVSNNPDVMNSPYYNENQIKIIKDPRDLDFDWIKDVTNTIYNYTNHYSPEKFIYFLMKYL